MNAAKDAILQTLTQLRTFLAQESVPRLSEADTKANFIEPLVAALGWSGIGVVTREYYVRNSQEFIDYVMAGPSGLGAKPGPLLAIEAKALQSDLTEKNAAQLIQYCSVEGIEWAALTNGRELQFFNTFLKPDLSAKRVLRLDLLAFNNDEEFDILSEQLWQLSRESMTTEGSRAWLNQLRLDNAVREIMLNPGSSTIRQLRRALGDAEVKASTQELVQWFRTHLNAPITRVGPLMTAGSSKATVARVEPHTKSLDAQGNQALLEALQMIVNERFPDVSWRVLKYYTAAECDGQTFMAVRKRGTGLVLGLTLPVDISSPALTDNAGEFNWGRMTKIARVESPIEVDDTLLNLMDAARQHAGRDRVKQHFGVTLRDLLDAGVLEPETPLIFTAGSRELARATLTATGEIMWEGQPYRSLSDKTFARLLAPTRDTVNGWTHWMAELPSGRQSLAKLRAEYMARSQQSTTA